MAILFAQAPGTAKLPRGAVPAHQLSLKGLPAALTGVGSIDLFINEDITYARRLLRIWSGRGQYSACATMLHYRGSDFVALCPRLAPSRGLCSSLISGRNENTNGLLSQHFPKGTDSRAHSHDAIVSVATMARWGRRPIRLPRLASWA